MCQSVTPPCVRVLLPLCPETVPRRVCNSGSSHHVFSLVTPAVCVTHLMLIEDNSAQSSPALFPASLRPVYKGLPSVYPIFLSFFPKRRSNSTRILRSTLTGKRSLGLIPPFRITMRRVEPRALLRGDVCAEYYPGCTGWCREERCTVDVQGGVEKRGVPDIHCLLYSSRPAWPGRHLSTSRVNLRPPWPVDTFW